MTRKQKESLSKEDKALLESNSEQKFNPPYASDVMPDDPHHGHGSNVPDLVDTLKEPINYDKED